jgi:hypothetical protein
MDIDTLKRLQSLSAMNEQQDVDSEDGEDESDDTKIKKLVRRYHAASTAMLSDEDKRDVDRVAAKHREQDDTFTALSSLSGGADKAVKHLMSHMT